MESYSIVDEDWQLVLQLLPEGWQEQAAGSGALSRLRGFRSAEALLRTLLLHVARGYSLRETAVRAKATGIAEVSDVALLKRLRNSEVWLRELCGALLKENGVRLPGAKPGINVRVVDGTIVKEPGKTGSQWRIHYSLRVPSLSCDFFTLTAAEGVGNGESLTQFAVAPDDYIIADRAYSSVRGVSYLSAAGARCLVRVNTASFPLWWEKRGKMQAFPLLQQVSALQTTGAAKEWEVAVRTPEAVVSGRLCVLRKSVHASSQATRRLRRKASRNQAELREETVEFAKYVILFTTFPRALFSTREVLEWYRVRWQIELVFKRFKSIAKLGHLPKYDEQSSKAWLYGKLLAALLTQKLVRVGRDFSPWGYALENRPTAE